MLLKHVMLPPITPPMPQTAAAQGRGARRGRSQRRTPGPRGGGRGRGTLPRTRRVPSCPVASDPGFPTNDGSWWVGYGWLMVVVGWLVIGG